MAEPGYGDSAYAYAGLDMRAGVSPIQTVQTQEVPGWTGDHSSPSTDELSAIEIDMFACSPGILPDRPIREFFVPRSIHIPEERCLLPGSLSTAMNVPSDCRCEMRGLTQPEVVGCDPRLNSSAEEITRFFLTHLKKPRAFLKVEGWHTVTTKHKDPKGHTNTLHHRETDFE
jgi:hypothetical protein